MCVCEHLGDVGQLQLLQQRRRRRHAAAAARRGGGGVLARAGVGVGAAGWRRRRAAVLPGARRGRGGGALLVRVLGGQRGENLLPQRERRLGRRLVACP